MVLTEILLTVNGSSRYHYRIITELTALTAQSTQKTVNEIINRYQSFAVLTAVTAQGGEHFFILF